MIGIGQNKSIWINAGFGISNNLEGSDFDIYSDENKFISPLLSLNLMLPINENFNIDLILSYNKNKIKSDNNQMNSTDFIGNPIEGKTGIAVENNLSYVSINPSLELKLFKNLFIKKTSFSIGPFLGYAVHNDRKYIVRNVYAPQLYDNLDVTEEELVQNVDFGIKLGLSYLLTNKLKIVTEYKLGLTDLNNDINYTYTDNSSVQSRNVNISLAYRLLKK